AGCLGVLAARRLRRSRSLLELVGGGLARDAHRSAAHEAAGSLLAVLSGPRHCAVPDRRGQVLTLVAALLGRGGGPLRLASLGFALEVVLHVLDCTPLAVAREVPRRVSARAEELLGVDRLARRRGLDRDREAEVGHGLGERHGRPA